MIITIIIWNEFITPSEKFKVIHFLKKQIEANLLLGNGKSNKLNSSIK